MNEAAGARPGIDHPLSPAGRLAAIVLAAAVALAGCAEANELLGAGPTFEGAPDEVAARLAVPFCGEENISLPEPSPNLEARTCFWEAYQVGRPAEFVSRNTTMEGDAITTIYRSLDGGGAIVYIDSTQDRWSAQTWLRLDCPDLVLDPESPDQPAFGTAEGCLESTLD